MKEAWVDASSSLPENGTIVFVKSKKFSCSCGGFQEREVYFDNGIFNGIVKQSWIKKWRVSPNNYLIKELDLRKQIMPEPCNNCIG